MGGAAAGADKCTYYEVGKHILAQTIFKRDQKTNAQGTLRVCPTCETSDPVILVLLIGMTGGFGVHNIQTR